MLRWAQAARQAAQTVARPLRPALPAARRPATGGSEPIKPMDPRTQGGKGIGDKPYELKKPKQDGPPPGGFPPIKTTHEPINTTSLPSSVIIALTAVTMGYGFYGVYKSNRARRALKQEKWFIRTNLVPVLQAEEDVWYLERLKKKLAKEAEIMKDVPGWVVGESVYHSKKWTPMPMNEMYYPGKFGPIEND